VPGCGLQDRQATQADRLASAGLPAKPVTQQFAEPASIMTTGGQSNLANAASNPWGKLEAKRYVPWVPKSLHPKQNINLLSRVTDRQKPMSWEH